MNLLLVTVGVLVAGLLGLLLWSTFKKTGARRTGKHQMESISLHCKHVPNLSQIRQALDRADFEYLAAKVNEKAARRMHAERRRIALKYLAGLRGDFEQLMDAAQVVASLSPQVEAKEEWKRFRLSVEFKVKYQLVRAKIAMHAPGFRGLENLVQLVSSLAMNLERAVGEIGIAAMGPAAAVSTKS